MRTHLCFFVQLNHPFHDQHFSFTGHSFRCQCWPHITQKTRSIRPKYNRVVERRFSTTTRRQEQHPCDMQSAQDVKDSHNTSNNLLRFPRQTNTQRSRENSPSRSRNAQDRSPRPPSNTDSNSCRQRLLALQLRQHNGVKVATKR